MSRPWLILDRDDTILDDPGYLSDPQKIRFLPGAVAGLKRFHAAGWPLVVVTNQSGLGRGYFGLQELESVHARLRSLLCDQGVDLAGIYFCPHAPDEGCDCRKPKPDLAYKASRALGLSLSDCVVVGDKESDLRLGWAVKARYVAQIVAKQKPSPQAQGHFQDLNEMANFFLGESFSSAELRS